MEIEFSWMTYFVSLFVLVVLSIALSLLCPSGGWRDPTVDDRAEQHPGSER
ncbi:hypothetical protein [Paraburkholderia sp.]|uniref:hypothetical protein n=1 Tax=Paraburkholderia sp. TaxID=1926495 RepID=UPI0025D86921|nr:hypothetical protein [Paraburkholderia sp.]